MDLNFKLVFKTIIEQKIKNYKGIPLTWEDFYFEFLYHIPKYVEKFDFEMKVPFKSYLGLQCKYFTSNKCRMFNSNKFKVLNNYYSINEKESYLRVNDKDDIKIPLDISSLNEIEKLIFKDFFIEDLNLNTISKKINLSKYKIKKKINLIKLKLFEQIKN
jgi:hypothetical protein